MKCSFPEKIDKEEEPPLKEPADRRSFPEKTDKGEPELKELTDPPMEKVISLKGISKTRSRKKLFVQEPVREIAPETQKT